MVKRLFILGSALINHNDSLAPTALTSVKGSLAWASVLSETVLSPGERQGRGLQDRTGACEKGQLV